MQNESTKQKLNLLEPQERVIEILKQQSTPFNIGISEIGDKFSQRCFNILAINWNSRPTLWICNAKLNLEIFIEIATEVIDEDEFKQPALAYFWRSMARLKLGHTEQASTDFDRSERIYKYWKDMDKAEESDDYEEISDKLHKNLTEEINQWDTN